MTVLVLEALTGIAVSLAILMAMAWMVRERTGNSGWVDTIWTFSVGAVGAGGALWPVAGAAPNPRQWLGWLAYPVIAISWNPSWDLAWDYGCGWATLLAPVCIYWILVHVTGIPPLELQMLRSRGERYRDYQARTDAFFPRPPQKGLVT
jgi:steroid 5-alpha reductase family enzyme